MAQEKDKATVNAYSLVMQEIRLRQLFMDIAMKIPNGLPPIIIRELCFLQLRMICELMALGCIIAHRDTALTKTIKSEYSADRIMKHIERLEPDFFPWPVTFTPIWRTIHLMKSTNETPLTKEEFFTFYGQCGDVLHRGHLKRLFSGELDTESSDYGDIQSWKKKIADLLLTHRIMLAKTKSVILCMTDENNKVRVGIADWHEPSQTTP